MGSLGDIAWSEKPAVVLSSLARSSTPCFSDTCAVELSDSRAAGLAIDLITSRIEGEATGILMARHHITRAQAAMLLRRASQQRQRKLHEIAAGVVRGGDLDSRVQRAASSPERHVDLHIASARD
jgi:hypothetical protein